MKQPRLRFPKFQGDWKVEEVGQLLRRVSEPVDVKSEEQYRQIGVRSHGKGVFHKEPVLGSELGEKRVFWVKPNAMVINIVFAWEQALAITSEAERGFVASHRFPMFSPVVGASYLPFMFHFFMRKQGKNLLTLASPGGAGRNKTLGQSEFSKLKVAIPNVDEQTKIADFLNVVEDRISTLAKKRELLSGYKDLVTHNLFAKKIRFKRDDGSEFPQWEETKLGSHLVPHVERVPASTTIRVYSSSRDGLKAQRDYFSDRELANDGEYGVVPRGYMTYRHMSDDATFVFNINDVADRIAVSKEYPVFATTEMNIRFLRYYLNSGIEFKRFAAKQKLGGTRTRLYFRKLTEWKIIVPHVDEQKKIADFLGMLDAKIDAVTHEISATIHFKSGLLQQMFV
jgi:type I restriction enzyme S subunit